MAFILYEMGGFWYKLFRCLNRLIIKEDNYVQELDRLYELSLIYGSIFGFSKCYAKLTWVVQSR